MKRTSVRAALLAFALLVVGPLGWLADTVFALRLAVEPQDGGKLVDVQFLGEYEQSLQDITIRTEDGAIVWQARANGDAMYVRAFFLRPGVNPRVLGGLENNDGVAVVIPNRNESFVLDSRVSYTVRISRGNLPTTFCIPRYTCRSVIIKL
jgi:hypothetical protein